jgi:hypothetical protein
MKKRIILSAKYLLTIIAVLSTIVFMLELLSSYKPSQTIHANAPVKTKQSIIVNAPAEKVWSVFTEVDNWAVWQKEISRATLHEPFQPGSTIEWETNGFTIKSQLQTVEPYTKLGWAGKAFGSFAIHTWKFEEQHGKTTVTVEESMEGWLVWLMQKYVQKNLYTATDYWLKALKQESEK